MQYKLSKKKRQNLTYPDYIFGKKKKRFIYIYIEKII